MAFTRSGVRSSLAPPPIPCFSRDQRRRSARSPIVSLQLSTYPAMADDRSVTNLNGHHAKLWNTRGNVLVKLAARLPKQGLHQLLRDVLVGGCS